MNLLETFTDSTNVFRSKSGKGERLHFLILQKSSWKRSPGHVEINFENRAEVYFAKDRRFFSVNVLKRLNKLLFKNFFLLSTFLWTPKMQILRTCRNFLPKSHFLLTLRRWTKSFNCQKKYSCSKFSPGLVKCSLDNPAHSFLPKF